MVTLGEDGLKEYIKTIGLFNSKAKNIISLSQDLIAKHNSQLPHDFEALKALAGVGVKTADVV
jgi:endonuclease-3